MLKTIGDNLLIQSNEEYRRGHLQRYNLLYKTEIKNRETNVLLVTNFFDYIHHRDIFIVKLFKSVIVYSLKVHLNNSYPFLTIVKKFDTNPKTKELNFSYDNVKYTITRNFNLKVDNVYKRSVL